MLPGPDLIYGCPDCAATLYVPCLMSGNTFGADFFSDGKCIAPMLPEYPVVTKCPKCQTIFWFDKLEPVAELEIGQLEHSAYSESPRAQFLDLSDYIGMIEAKLFDGTEEEIFIRKNILWQINDFVRWGQQTDIESEILEYFIENARILISILQPGNEGDSLFIAELYRNIGEFEKSIKILESITSPDYSDFATQMKHECKTGNKIVFQYKTDDY